MPSTRLVACAILLALGAAIPRAAHADAPTLRVFAAGSLRPAINQIAAAFSAATGIQTQITFGPFRRTAPAHRSRRAGRSLHLRRHGQPASPGARRQGRACRPVRPQPALRPGAPRPRRHPGHPARHHAGSRHQTSAPRRRTPTPPATTPGPCSNMPTPSAPAAG